jgi:protein SCO1/2
MSTKGTRMQNCTNPNFKSQLKFGNAKWNVVGLFALGMLLFSVASISDVKAEDQPDHSMHDMHNMQGMHDMEHMDHSMHQQELSKRGTYSSSAMTYTIPDLKMVDVNGKNISLRELMNERSPIILNFIFTTCTTICPVMSATFQQVQEQLGSGRKNVRLVSISIDPEHDTPPTLKAFADKFNAGPRWTFLTGTLENSLAIQKSFGVFAGEKMNHKPVTFLKAKGSGSQWIKIDGLAEASQIIMEYDKLVPEKEMHK